MHNLIFLLPIAFGTSLLYFIDGKKDGAAEYSMACSVLRSLFASFERGKKKSAIFTKSATFSQRKV